MALQTETHQTLSKKLDPLMIEPTIELPSEFSFSYLHTIQQILRSIIPKALLEDELDPGTLFFRLNKLLPLVKYPEKISHTQAVPVAFLCPSDYTPGVGRYIADSLSRWLVPGKQFAIIGRVSLNFRFVIHPTSRFYLTQEMIAVPDPKDLDLVAKNLPRFIEELKINIMAVYHARYISALRSSLQQNKRLILQENLSSLLNPSDELNQSLFDQFQGILTKTTAEEKINQIKKNISYLMNSRPKTFDRDMFYEIAQYNLLFRGQFSSSRDSRHISRVIAYQYLFKKVVQEKAQRHPTKRHLSFKMLKRPLSQDRTTIALLFCFNFLRENECFEFRHLMEGIRATLPYLESVPDSFIADRRHEKVRFFYVELKKIHPKPFTSKEIKHLKERLPKEMMKQIETSVHPIFLPRNEEEILRNLILLAKQIKYVRDLPQVSIHFDMQSDADVIFTIIAVRLMKESTPSVHRILQKLTHLKVELDDVRNAGYLKKKYRKEAAVLRVTLDKTPFFRADFSVDLLKARQKIVLELTKAIGEFRDYNGGIIFKQEEALTSLRSALFPLSSTKELLLENYFYSLRPGIMQTVYETTLLKSHFLLLRSLLEQKADQSYDIATKRIGKYFLVFIKALSSSFKENLMGMIHTLKVPSHDLASAFFEVESKTFLGFILKAERNEKAVQFLETIQLSLKNWEQNFLCPIPSKEVIEPESPSSLD